MLTRFDIPRTVREMFEKAVEINLIDVTDVITISFRYPDNLDLMVNELIDIAWANRHTDPAGHRMMVVYYDQYTMEKDNG